MRQKEKSGILSVTPLHLPFPLISDATPQMQRVQVQREWNGPLKVNLNVRLSSRSLVIGIIAAEG